MSRGLCALFFELSIVTRLRPLVSITLQAIDLAGDESRRSYGAAGLARELVSATPSDGWRPLAPHTPGVCLEERSKIEKRRGTPRGAWPPLLDDERLETSTCVL